MTALAHERPETMSDIRTEPVSPAENGPDLDDVLWRAWKAMELPEGYRAEIIEGAIEVSPTVLCPMRRSSIVCVGDLTSSLRRAGTPAIRTPTSSTNAGDES
ncbi:hypothetical protein [Streptomyces sp. NPDC018693]|uniref:hypothetical protein n=1 Tax=unclassified Streptomyces TaxID=2593676 RepID=UPI0037ACFDDE